MGSLRHERGFTLAELAVVLAVVAVLSGTVLLGRGFVQQARASNAAALVDTLRKASRAYAERLNGGRDFADVSIAALQSAGLITNPFAGPWPGTVTVSANNPPTSLTVHLCAPNTYLAQDVAILVASMGSVNRYAGCPGAPNGSWSVDVVTR